VSEDILGAFVFPAFLMCGIALLASHSSAAEGFIEMHNKQTTTLQQLRQNFLVAAPTLTVIFIGAAIVAHLV
jgi:hypothetical protein